MRKMSLAGRKWCARCLLLLLLSSTGCGVSNAGTITRPPPMVMWGPNDPAFMMADQQAITHAVQQTLTTQPAEIPQPDSITIAPIQRSGDWAVFNAVATSSQLASESTEFFGHYQNSTWTLLLPGTADFCSQLTQVPDALLNAVDKSYFC